MTLATADFDYVRTLVHDRSAIVLDTGKGYLVETRLAAIVRAEGLASVTDLVARLRGEPWGSLHSDVVDAMTTNETSFFRDTHPFSVLRDSIVPELIERRASTRTLTFWSAGCSSGQEAYSVAMLLTDHFPELAEWNVRIIATDLSAEMLGRAAAATYSQLEVSRGLPASMLVRHFDRDGLRWRIKPAIREMVELRTLNLAAATWPFLPAIDVILLRNVLIYFDIATKRAVLENVRRVLRPEGYIFFGGAETTLGIDERYERVPFERATAYRLHANHDGKEAKCQ